ncbi:MAG: hypothetical protein K2P81_15855 [Bacteriovoracaceae bacterium]|nr:hypothetical protein [Bacteriovoracaceae bacterium]
MGKLIVFVGIMLLALGAFAQDDYPETGWRAQARPLLVKILGVDTTAKLIGAEPMPPVVEEMKLPALPTLERKNTDASVYKMDSELRKQGKDFDALPADKRRSYEVAFLKELFLATRRAPAKEEDLSKWLNVLEGGGSREGVYRGLVLDEVYASMENFEEVPSAKLISWTQEFTKKYLALAFKEEVLKQGNSFFIKRVISEKVLEMLDTLESKPEDFRTWYAVFSAQVAKEFPSLWKGSIRSNPSAEVHLQWAKKSHIQHIKSEVLIKLHSAMNAQQDAQ